MNTPHSPLPAALRMVLSAPSPMAAAAVTPRAHWQADLAVAVIVLALLLAWDATGWDLAAAGLFGNAHGFAWHDNFIASRVLHDGGRSLAWVVMLALVVSAARARPTSQTPRREPGRAERWRWLGWMLLCMLVVPALKRMSSTSCPWDQSVFGGVAQYVSHWQWGQADGGPGHCFPSGHAVAAFGFFGMYFLWRGHDARRAQVWLAAVLSAGLLFGAAQLVRGAHYPSHTLWSAWLCWTVCAAAAALAERHHGS